MSCTPWGCEPNYCECGKAYEGGRRMNIGLKKWFSRKTKAELIELCYQLHLENLKLKEEEE